jgi:DNA mismatch endonuclease, patch repair protein
MVDIVAPDVRSWMMSGIRGRNTRPELVLRKGLHKAGFRYLLHAKGLSGKPDIVFPKHGAVIFVHGCFWHGQNCHLFRWPTTRAEFWQAKIAANKARDRKSHQALSIEGWRVGTVWECAIKGRTKLDREQLLKHLGQWLVSREGYTELTGTNNE